MIKRKWFRGSIEVLEYMALGWVPADSYYMEARSLVKGAAGPRWIGASNVHVLLCILYCVFLTVFFINGELAASDVHIIVFVLFCIFSYA